jgi:type I restriction-modification system DNA methylase subunit
MDKQKQLVQFFMKACNHIAVGEWDITVINRKHFRNLHSKNQLSLSSEEDAFTALNMFAQRSIEEYAIDFLLYKWLKDHDDERYKEFSFIISPYNRQFDMRGISFEDIMHFVSPETKKTSGGERTKTEEEKALAEKFKKVFGEVFTPTELVNEMLDKLPKEVWLDPTKTWLDPACGTGNFLLEVYRRLMDSLKEIIPNEEERREHILNNQIHGVELQERNVILCKMRLDPNDDYDIHIACADALTFYYWNKNAQQPMETKPLFELPAQ